jgi:hypothetical protein
MFVQDAVLPPRRREYITADASDPAAYDERGILKDGYRIRVPISMMDNAPPQRSAPLSITTGLRLDREFFPDGSPRTPRAPRTQRSQPVVDADQYRDHKPGFRDAARITADAGQTAKDAAYNEMVADLQDAWKPDHLRAAVARRTTADAIRPLGVSDAEWARAEGIREMSDAWKTPPPVLDAAAVAVLPAGRYPLSAGEGNPCTIDGAVGTLQRDGNYLVCRAKPPIGPTRSGTSAGDAKDVAWREMVDHVTNAWKT